MMNTKRQRVFVLMAALVLVATAGVMVFKLSGQLALAQPSLNAPFTEKQHQAFMARAIELSRKAADEGGGPFGAVIVSAEGKILGEGFNHVALNTDPTAHGEVMAIRNAAKNTGHFNLKGAVLYTSTYPCPMCYAAAHWANINTIFYANHPKDVAPDFDDQALWNALSQGDVYRVYSMPSQRQAAKKAFQYWQKKVGQGKAVPYNPTEHSPE